MKQFLAAVTAVAAVVCCGATTAWAQSATHVMVTPGDLRLVVHPLWRP